MRETKKLVGPVKEGGMTNGRVTNEGGKMRGREDATAVRYWVPCAAWRLFR